LGIRFVPPLTHWANLFRASGAGFDVVHTLQRSLRCGQQTALASGRDESWEAVVSEDEMRKSEGRVDGVL